MHHYRLRLQSLLAQENGPTQDHRLTTTTRLARVPIQSVRQSTPMVGLARTPTLSPTSLAQRSETWANNAWPITKSTAMIPPLKPYTSSTDVYGTAAPTVSQSNAASIPYATQIVPCKKFTKPPARNTIFSSDKGTISKSHGNASGTNTSKPMQTYNSSSPP